MRVRLSSLLLCGILLLAVTATTAPAPTSAAPAVSPQALVASYVNNFNIILKGGSTSQLPQIYAPTATLKFATPDGKTATFHGLAAIAGWYKAFAASNVGVVIKVTTVRSPVTGMVIHYELGYNAKGVVVGRCAHFFAVVNGLIVSDDFVVYWAS
jgi:hypothetical protein